MHIWPHDRCFFLITWPDNVSWVTWANSCGLGINECHGQIDHICTNGTIDPESGKAGVTKLYNITMDRTVITQDIFQHDHNPNT